MSLLPLSVHPRSFNRKTNPHPWLNVKHNQQTKVCVCVLMLHIPVHVEWSNAPLLKHSTGVMISARSLSLQFIKAYDYNQLKDERPKYDD